MLFQQELHISFAIMLVAMRADDDAFDWQLLSLPIYFSNAQLDMWDRFPLPKSGFDRVLTGRLKLRN